MMKFKTIRGQLIFAFLIAILMTTILVKAFSYYEAQKSQEVYTVQKLENMLKLGSQAFSDALWDYDYEAIEGISKSIVNDEEVYSLRILESDNSLIYEYVDSRLEKKKIANQHMYQGEKKIRYGKDEIGRVEIITTDIFSKEKLQQQFTADMLLAVFQVITVILAITYISKKTTEPLEKLEQLAVDISEGKYETEIKIVGNAEVVELGTTILKMRSILMEQNTNIYNKMMELNKKNKTIRETNVEIQALYEETTAMNEELENMIEQMNKDYKATVLALSNAIEASDEYTRGHCDRVVHYAMAIAEKINLPEVQKNDLEYAAMLHDVGKIGIPETVLNKPGKLTNDEFALIQKHPQIGAGIIGDIDFLKKATKVVLQHHERLDGKGYPNHIKSGEILLLAKILSVADGYDAMTSSRPYRKSPLTIKEAIIELENGIGTQYDETIVKALIAVLEDEGEIFINEIFINEEKQRS